MLRKSLTEEFIAMKTMKILGLVAVMAMAMIFSGRSVAQSGSASSDPAVDAYIDAMRADFRADKIDLITDAMQFSQKDAAAFWPVYKRYQAEVTGLNDERVQLIKTYADKWTTMTDADAKSLAQKSLDLEGRRNDVRKKYFAQFNQVLPGLTVAKFFQLEHRLDLLVDLKLASELPSLLVRDSGTSSGSQKKPN
jgi:hypothetical protein